MDFKLHNGSGGLCCKSCSRQDNKLNTYDWLADIPGNAEESDMVEVQFKNTRKGYYRNSNKIKLEKGDVVAVEATPGHDIGVVTLTGRLVPLQMRKANIKPDVEIKRIYRKAKQVDMDKYNEAKGREHSTMIRARQIALNLNLNMKIGDVEYQGDGNKAIFYYIADERVDFRQLIKVLADAFHVRIEMKQIGARQEAGRIGGIGPCGRELCCATWMTSFVSVSTSAARYQDISLNPQKLAGQCGKLKCCLNYEVDAYIDEQKDFPSTNIWLNTGEGMLYHQKTDIFGRNMSYSFDKEGRGTLIKLSVARVKEIIAMNKRGQIPAKAIDSEKEEQVNIGYTDGVGEESLNRFDEKKQNQGKRNHSRNRNNRKSNQKENNNTNNENKPKENPGNSTGNKPENRNENRQGNRPKHRPENRNNNQQGNRSNEKPANRPDGPKVLRKQDKNNKPDNKENNKPAEQ